MLLTLPTLSFADRLGGSRLNGEEEAIRLIAEAGFDGFDFSLDRETDMTVFPNVMIGDRPDYEVWTEHLRKVAGDAGISCCVAHAADCTGSPDKEENEIIFKQIVRGMEIAGMMGAKAIVVHAYGEVGDFANHKEAYLSRNLEFFKRLLPYAKEYNIKIALENSADKICTSPQEPFVPGFGTTPEMFCEMIDRLDSEWFTACVDVGHLAMCGVDPASLIRGLGKERLFMLHVHDNDCKADQHLLPYAGRIKFKEITKALHDIRYDGVIDIEVFNFFYTVPSALLASQAKYVCEIGRYLLGEIKK